MIMKHLGWVGMFIPNARTGATQPDYFVLQGKFSTPVQVSHNSSLGEWMNLTVCTPCGPGSIPNRGGVFQGIFPNWSHSANPSWASVTENGAISPQWHHTACGQLGGRPNFNYGQTMAGKKCTTSIAHAKTNLRLVSIEVARLPMVCSKLGLQPPANFCHCNAGVSIQVAIVSTSNLPCCRGRESGPY